MARIQVNNTTQDRWVEYRLIYHTGQMCRVQVNNTTGQMGRIQVNNTTGQMGRIQVNNTTKDRWVEYRLIIPHRTDG